MESMVPSFLLVDGNNVIHAWPDLLELHRQGKGLAHSELIKHLTAYQDFSGERVVVVFDGRGPQLSNEREPGGLQVMYSKDGKTADDVIERLAGKYSGKYEITVATDDRAEQDMVTSMGAFVISAEGLRERLDRAEGDLNRFLERRRKDW